VAAQSRHVQDARRRREARAGCAVLQTALTAAPRMAAAGLHRRSANEPGVHGLSRVPRLRDVGLQDCGLHPYCETAKSNGTLHSDGLGQNNPLAIKEFRPLSRCPRPSALQAGQLAGAKRA
jgi:hypothetical protein